MVLEEKFHDKITSLIHKTLKSNEISSPELKQKVWGYEFDDDFKYGHKAGFLIGLIIGDYIEIYERFPSSDELIEIRKILESFHSTITTCLRPQYLFHPTFFQAHFHELFSYVAPIVVVHEVLAHILGILSQFFFLS